MKIDYPAESQIPALKALWAKCFPDPQSAIDAFFTTGFSLERCRVVNKDGNIAAALYWLDAAYRDQKLAYLYAVATDPECRGQGLCRLLMEDTHLLLRSQGYAAALLLPGEPGLRQMYAGFGYDICCQWEEFTREAEAPVPLTEITWKTYEALRPGFLPRDGAVQTGLDFFATYGKFYQGEGFLLAAAREGENLLGMELLGDAQAASGILAALNCKKGTFRTPGRGKEGAMALKLKADALLPGYFGLTFD